MSDAPPRAPGELAEIEAIIRRNIVLRHMGPDSFMEGFEEAAAEIAALRAPQGDGAEAKGSGASAAVYALGPLDPKPLGLALGCCSATSPCDHQKRDPMTLCTTCERSWQRAKVAHIERIFGTAPCDGSGEAGDGGDHD